MIPQHVFRFFIWLALGSWVGSWAFFAFVVSQVAFQVLPGDVAGDLAGDLLSILHFGGAVAAFAVAGANVGLGRSGWVVGLPVALALVCLLSEGLLSPEVTAVRPSALGAQNTMETQQRFRTLHALSLGLFMTVHLASIGLMWLQARLDTRDSEAAARARSGP